MITATEARREYLARREHRRTAFEAEIEGRGCPECGHDSYIVTEAYPETLVDSACWEGRCACKEKNRGGFCLLCDPQCDYCECECHCTCDYDD